ncbi:hypothetical protein T439DRAFT_320217 [Meredithblackwellia eburnea MCA 4105]
MVNATLTKRYHAPDDTFLLPDSPTDDNDDYDSPRPVKRKRTSHQGESKAAKKEHRMERNRLAAQASRDRKKAQTNHLENRVAELEAQLALERASRASRSRRSSLSSSTAASTPAPPASLLLSPSSSLVLSASSSLSLEDENFTLRSQLQDERVHSAALRSRLSALETKFSRLEQLLSGPALPPLPPLPSTTTAIATLPSPLPYATPSPSAITSPAFSSSSVSPVANANVSSTSSFLLPASGSGVDNNSCLVAREVDSSLQRKLLSHRRPCPHSLTRPPPVQTMAHARRRRPQPTLHQILAAIVVPSTTSSRTNSITSNSTLSTPVMTPTTLTSHSISRRLTNMSFRPPGQSGRPGSILTTTTMTVSPQQRLESRRRRSRLVSRTQGGRRRESLLRPTMSTCLRTSRMPRFQLFIRR